jgi:hypothetical protein
LGRNLAQGFCDEIQPILAKIQLAVDKHAGGTENASFNGCFGIFLEHRLNVFIAGESQNFIGIETVFAQYRSDSGWIIQAPGLPPISL